MTTIPFARAMVDRFHRGAGEATGGLVVPGAAPGAGIVAPGGAPGTDEDDEPGAGA